MRYIYVSAPGGGYDLVPDPTYRETHKHRADRHAREAARLRSEVCGLASAAKDRDRAVHEAARLRREVASLRFRLGVSEASRRALLKLFCMNRSVAL